MIVLALVHENTRKLSVVLDDELQKLIDVKAYLKVLIFYPDVPVIPDQELSSDGKWKDVGLTHPEIQEKICSAQIRNSDENYVIINIIYNAEDLLEISGCSIDSYGKAEELGWFQVKYPKKD